MNVLFRLKKDIRDFYSIKDAHDLFINILPKRDQNCFFNNKRLRELKAHDTIYDEIRYEKWNNVKIAS